MTVVLQFVTVFLGAFFAFGLENYREQRRTRRWVHEYLSQLFAGLESALAVGNTVRAHLTTTIEDTRVWQRAEHPDQLDEAAWQRLAEVPQSNAIDLSAVLRTEAITVLAQPMAQALAEVEMAGRLLEAYTAQLIAMHDRDVLPLWYERRVPLTVEEARRIARFEAGLGQLTEATDAALASVQHWLEVYRTHPTVSRRRARGLGLWRPRWRLGTPPAPDGSPARESR